MNTMVQTLATMSPTERMVRRESRSCMKSEQDSWIYRRGQNRSDGLVSTLFSVLQEKSSI